MIRVIPCPSGRARVEREEDVRSRLALGPSIDFRDIADSQIDTGHIHQTSTVSNNSHD